MSPLRFGLKKAEAASASGTPPYTSLVIELRIAPILFTTDLEIAMTRTDALTELAEGIVRCFGHVNLRFASDVAGQGSVQELKALAKRWNLSRHEIETAIRPGLQDWLDHGYTPHGENRPRPWHEDPEQRRMKAAAMSVEACFQLSDR